MKYANEKLTLTKLVEMSATFVMESEAKNEIVFVAKSGASIYCCQEWAETINGITGKVVVFKFNHRSQTVSGCTVNDACCNLDDKIKYLKSDVDRLSLELKRQEKRKAELIWLRSLAKDWPFKDRD